VKEVLACWKRDVVAVRYRVEPPRGRRAQLELLPMVSLRDFHSLQRGTDKRYEVCAEGDRVAVKSDQHTLHLRCEGATFKTTPDWWKGHWYAIEAERGQDHVEDLYTPGRFVAQVGNGGATVSIISSLSSVESFDWDAEAQRRGTGYQPVSEGMEKHGLVARATLAQLTRAANDFIVDRKCPDDSPGATVIAGYPWFADWGRDTMISLPGLLLTTGRFKEAAQVLTLFASYVSEGMIPNKFDDYTSEPHYNTVDASLWFIHACHEYLRTSGDAGTFEGKLLPACRAIIDGYARGTRWNIKVDARDGLVSQGDENTQLTWMDAKCDGVAFTPRQGKAVEINALWYNALVLMGMKDRATQVRESFVKAFWISPFRGLCDVVDGSRRDTSIRPNQVFAVSLPHSPLDRDQQRAVVEVVRRELLTSVGLRTLAPGDPKFRSAYTGPQFHRDGAYHNGTIWPWLLGAFLEAYVKVNDRSDDSIQQARAWLSPLIEMMQSRGCIGQIAEIFEATEPYRPVGCPAQAWSVAEALRLAVMLGM
jgi:predicted glycogen debranching enzyme